MHEQWTKEVREEKKQDSNSNNNNMSLSNETKHNIEPFLE